MSEDEHRIVYAGSLSSYYAVCRCGWSSERCANRYLSEQSAASHLALDRERGEKR